MIFSNKLLEPQPKPSCGKHHVARVLIDPHIDVYRRPRQLGAELFADRCLPCSIRSDESDSDCGFEHGVFSQRVPFSKANRESIADCGLWFCDWFGRDWAGNGECGTSRFT